MFAGCGAGQLLAFDLRKLAFTHFLVGAHAKNIVGLELDPLRASVLASASADGEFFFVSFVWM